MRYGSKDVLRTKLHSGELSNPIRESNFMRGAGTEADWINKLSYLERETTKEKQEQH